MNRLIYLDNAATTFPKPPEVIRAVTDCMKSSGGNPGRGSHRLALAAANILYDCRESAAALVGLSDPARILFTQSTTHALNLVIKGLLRDGDHVLISDLEHNSVWRPIHALSAAGMITYDVFSSAALLRQGADYALGPLIRPETRMIVSTHMSNICSISLPLAEIGRFCKKHGLFFVVDGAQSVGHLPVHVEQMQIDALCVPGHKGLYGPQGSGFAALSPTLDLMHLTPLLEGGSGYQSLLPDMPTESPERYEAGTVQTPAIAGLHAGIRFVQEVGIEALQDHASRLFLRARDLLSALPGTAVYASDTVGSVLSFSVRGLPAEEVAEHLDKGGICVRPGFHCAALAHGTLKTPKESGTVRLGFGYFNTEKELDATVRRLKTLL